MDLSRQPGTPDDASPDEAGGIGAEWKCGQSGLGRVTHRYIGLGAGTLGTSVAASFIHSVLTQVLVSAQAVIILVIIGSALFGSERYSARAVRLICLVIGRAPSPFLTSGQRSPAGPEGP